MLNVKLGGTYSDHWALEGSDIFDAVNQGQPIKRNLPVSAVACGLWTVGFGLWVCKKTQVMVHSVTKMKK